jgi:hypothetical protein
MAKNHSTRRRANRSPEVAQAIELLTDTHSILMLVVGALQDYEHPNGRCPGVLDAGYSVHTGGALRATKTAMAKINTVWDLVDEIKTPDGGHMVSRMIEVYGLLLLAVHAMPAKCADKHVGVPEQCAVHVAARMVKDTLDKLERCTDDSAEVARAA